MLQLQNVQTMNVNLHINGIEVQCEQVKVGQFASREKII
jgi:hypothetical protein